MDLNDIFLYEANTEGTRDFSSFKVDRNGGVNDSVQSGPQTANRIRGIDSADGTRVGPFTQAQDGNLPLGLLAQGTGFYNRPSIYVDGGAIKS